MSISATERLGLLSKVALYRNIIRCERKPKLFYVSYNRNDELLTPFVTK